MTVRFGYSLSNNGLDETLRCESLPLSRVHLIKDGALGFFHVMREEEMLCDRVYPIVNRRVRCRQASIKVHRAPLISAIITPQMNG